MKKYYMRRDDQLKGPFTIAEILKSGLRSTDLVRSEEMTEWKLAVDLDDFKNHFVFLDKHGDEIKAIQQNRQVTDQQTRTGDYEESKYYSLFVWSLVIIMLLVVFYFLRQLF